MQSGFAADDPWADRHLDITTEALDAIVAAGARFACPPGTAFEYSNLGYGLIGRAVERIAGRRLQDLATSSPPGAARARRARRGGAGRRRLGPSAPRRGRRGPSPTAVPLGDGALAPMGGLWSTVEDLATVVSWFDDAFPAA